MSAKRNERKKKSKEKARRTKDQKLAMLHAVFDIFGLLERFLELPQVIIDRLVLNINPKPVVAIGDGLRGDAQALDLNFELSELIEEDFDLKEVGIPATISASNLFRVWLTLEDSLSEVAEVIRHVILDGKGNTKIMKHDLEKVEDLLDSLRSSDSNKLVLGFLMFKFDTAVNRRSSLCEWAYWYDLEIETTQSGRTQATFRILKHISQPIMVPTSSGNRKAFEIVRPVAFSYRSIRWDRAVVGLKGSGQIPVLVLKHAVERLEQRLPNPGEEYRLQDLMAESLEAPQIALRHGDTLMIEFRIGSLRFGYFVADLISEAVLVRTFKFITMQGTPESNKLREVLKLNRRDIEYLNLDNFFDLAYSDFQEDPVLSRLFDECGCGHIISLLQPEYRLRMLRNRAFDLKKYLGIGQGAGGMMDGRLRRDSLPVQG